MAWLDDTLGYGGAPAQDPFAYLGQQPPRPRSDPFAYLNPPAAAAPPQAAPPLEAPQQQLAAGNQQLQARAIEASRGDFMGGLYAGPPREKSTADLGTGAAAGGLSLPGQPPKQEDSIGAHIMPALGGAGTGAAIGSVVPGIGTAIGAGVGGALGFFGSFV